MVIDDEKTHALALKQFNAIQDGVREEREQCLEDRRFYSIAGAQWEGPLGEQFENKPKMEVNKVHLSIIRIINEYRNNRIAVDFIAKDGKRQEDADTCNGLLRADEQDSNADEAYDNAFEEAVGGGFGAWRLRACYEDEENGEDDYQRIRIEPITDADTSVFFDLSSKRKDKADAKYAFVITGMQRDAYEEEYDDDPDSWPKEMQQGAFDWISEDEVFIAEYYKVEKVKGTIHIYETIDGREERYSDEDLDNDEELAATLAAVGTKEIRTRKIEHRKVHKFILSGGGILEDCGYIAGKRIPIIPCYGKRWVIDGIERCMGHVRLQKDAQRLGNMQRSKLAEISALSSNTVPIMTGEQVAGHEDEWAEGNIKDYPYRIINPVTGPGGELQNIGPVGYTQPAIVPPALAALIQISDVDQRDLSGNQQSGDDIISGVSGKAVEMIQTRLDMQTFIYMSNFADAKKASGEVWLSMAKELYVEEGRKMKKLGEEGKVGMIELMSPTVDENGELIVENDLTSATFDVVVDVGPSSSSKKSATVRALTGMMQTTQDPATLDIITSMSMMNMEGEGMGDVREYFRKKLVRSGVVPPTKEDQAEMEAEAANAKDPNAEYLAAAAEEAQAKAANERASTIETIANAELKKAQAQKIMYEMQNPAQPAPERPDYESARISLDADKLRAEYELKKREIELKEQEYALKLAEAGAQVVVDDEGKKAVRNANEMAAEKMAGIVANAVNGLQTTLQEQTSKMEASSRAESEARSRALDEIKKPKKVVRENGRIIGIET
jgi:hypothetical protein